MQIQEKLRLLRQEMVNRGVDAYIIPSTDPHQSEYVCEHWQSRKWISGFTGSAGTVAITQEHAGLWTDSRYFLQAEQELSGSTIALHKMTNQFAPQYAEYLAENLPAGSKVAVDGLMWSQAAVEHIQQLLSVRGIELVDHEDLISPLWNDRPEVSDEKIIIHQNAYAGIEAAAKINHIRSQMAELGATYHIISALDDLAWTFNLRGRDVAFNPVFIAYAVIARDNAWIFMDENKLSHEVKDYLSGLHIEYLPYHTISTFLAAIHKDERILVDPYICSSALYKTIQCRIINGSSIPKKLKAIKNATECSHIRNVMRKDGAALAGMFYWLEHNIGKQPINEHDIVQQLATFRSRQPLYFGESFGAIVGYKSNGAIIHYDPPAEGSAEIKAEGILLVDSGGQYIDGTTDITRTVSLGSVTSEEMNHYTLILKGMIALSKIKFPAGTTGVQLDTLARQFLWEHGLNYLHGTGHGVGFFLNVHEPPQGFAAINSERGRTVMEPGMLSSNEPGYYIPGKYGMRIENLILCQKSDTEGFLGFETMTLYPFDLNLVDQKLLTPAEIRWINQYHQKVYDEVAPLLETDIKVWFASKCRQLEWKG